MEPREHTRCPSSGLGSVPAAAGIGLKPAHYHALLAERPALGFLEIHTENYMGAGGPPHRYLEALAEIYPLSFHGVGLSLGGSCPLNTTHLARWRELVTRYSPLLVSEHVAWSSYDGLALHDLLPIPYTQESLQAICEHVDQMQNALGRHVLIENPSRYVDFERSDIPEPEFLIDVTKRTGCGLLLDVNNVYVSARNSDEDPREYLASIPPGLVEEVHLAGHAVRVVGDREICIDDHGSPVTDAVWELYRETVARIGYRPTLIEWDTDVPEPHVLLQEAARADEAAAAALPATEHEGVNHVLPG